MIIQGASGLSYRPDNIRLVKRGKFTFTDTEHTGDGTTKALANIWSHGCVNIGWH